jgi:hypothetical protein
VGSASSETRTERFRRKIRQSALFLPFLLDGLELFFCPEDEVLVLARPQETFWSDRRIMATGSWRRARRCLRRHSPARPTVEKSLEDYCWKKLDDLTETEVVTAWSRLRQALTLDLVWLVPHQSDKMEEYHI